MSNNDKKLAHEMKEALQKRGVEMKLGQVYDLIAEVCGYKNHHTLNASEKSSVEIFASMDEMDGGIIGVDPTKESGNSYEISFLSEATVKINLGVKADNAYEATKRALEYIQNNEDHCRDVAENWSLEYLHGGVNMDEIHSHDFRVPKGWHSRTADRDELLEKTEKGSLDDWTTYSTLSLQGLEKEYPDTLASKVQQMVVDEKRLEPYQKRD